MSLADHVFEQRVQHRRAVRMARIDAMPAELRELVHHYGFAVVDAFLQAGITRPRNIRHLVETVLDEFSPTRGSHSSQGVRARGAR